MGQRAVFIDRDGVLNRTHVRDGKPYAPTRLEDFVLIPGVEAAVDRLKDAGFVLVVVTNQPDVGNGLVPQSVVEDMNAHLMANLRIDALKVCFHKQSEGCACRKPKPGMLMEAAHELDISMADSFMVGDRNGDILAGKAAGCRTIFIDNDYTSSEKPDNPDWAVRSFSQAAERILKTVTDSYREDMVQ